MWGRIAALFMLVSATPTGLLSMKMRAGVSNDRCVVTGSEKLRPESVASAICSEVEAAIDAEAPKVRYSADIRVLSPTRLAATLIVNGRTLPVQNFAVMDGQLSNASVKRFATALGVAVAKATKS